ncbi:MAG: rRNA maturation RNase YbeY [Patescibacteria group bacterium]|nr:rRNA maturation RNase YbeY [Patescibacteria group bacterium]
MPVNFTALIETSYKKDFFEKVIEKSLKKLDKKIKKQISLVLVDKKKIKELNKTYRKKDKATSVLTFHFSEKKNKNTFFEIPLKNNVLGEIFICPRKAKEEADKIDEKLEDRLKKLTIHGLLHLLGYKHKNKKERKLMEGIEDELIKTVG